MAEADAAAGSAPAAKPPVATASGERRAPASGSTNTAVSMGTAGGGIIVLWLFQCLHAHSIVVPSEECAFIIGGFLTPLGLAARAAILKRIGD